MRFSFGSGGLGVGLGFRLGVQGWGFGFRVLGLGVWVFDAHTRAQQQGLNVHRTIKAQDHFETILTSCPG